MKIISNNQTNSMRISCSSCHSILEVEAKDLNYFRSCMADSPTYSFRCPCCSKKNVLCDYEIPDNIKLKVTHN